MLDRKKEMRIADIMVRAAISLYAKTANEDLIAAVVECATYLNGQEDAAVERAVRFMADSEGVQDCQADNPQGLATTFLLLMSENFILSRLQEGMGARLNELQAKVEEEINRRIAVESEIAPLRQLVIDAFVSERDGLPTTHFGSRLAALMKEQYG